jgi:hypothetical protein
MLKKFVGRRISFAVIVGALALAVALPGTVSADTTGGPPPIGPAGSHDATLALTSITVTGKVIATVTVSYTCQPFQTYDWETGQTTETTAGRLEGGGATVVQAQGRTLDWGDFGLFGNAAICDGSTVNTATAPVTATVSPWKNGTAVVGASVYICDVQCSDSDYASTGPLTVRLSNR